MGESRGPLELAGACIQARNPPQVLTAQSPTQLHSPGAHPSTYSRRTFLFSRQRDGHMEQHSHAYKLVAVSAVAPPDGKR